MHTIDVGIASENKIKRTSAAVVAAVEIFTLHLRMNATETS